MTKPLSDEEKAQRKQARREAKAGPATATAEKKKEPKTEVIQPVAVEITFPAIMDLKQALAFDADGNLIIGVQFKAKVDQYEIFRLVNLLKQPHGTLYAVIGSPQSAMDFKFDEKTDKVEVIRAAKAIAEVPDKTVDKPQDEPQAETSGPLFPEPPAAVRIHAATFNYIPEEKKPYGVAIDYADGGGELHSVAGRGKNPTQAVMAGVKATNAFPADLKEPFEVKAALEGMDPSPECYKLIRVLEVGSFDGDFGQDKGGEEEPAQGD